MEQVKIFKSHGNQGELERDMNKWLSDMDGNIAITRVRHAASSDAGNHVTSTLVFYKKTR